MHNLKGLHRDSGRCVYHERQGGLHVWPATQAAKAAAFCKKHRSEGRGRCRAQGDERGAWQRC
eukprot:6604780-Prymnesium_polylepis.1